MDHRNRCDLAAVAGTADHHCCCREDLCNAVDGIVDGVSAPTQGTIESIITSVLILEPVTCHA